MLSHDHMILIILLPLKIKLIKWSKELIYEKLINFLTAAYAWVKCEREEDKDCYAVLQEEANVYGRRGSHFGAEDRFVRLTLLRSQDDFDLLLQRLNQLVLEESHRQSYFVHDLKTN